MATDLEVSVRRQLDRLRKELAAATGQVAALQDEIKRHELVYDMLDGRKTGKRSRRGRSGAGALKTGAARRDDRLGGGLRDSARSVHAGFPARPQDGGRKASRLPQAGSRAVVKGGRIRRTGRGIYEKT